MSMFGNVNFNSPDDTPKAGKQGEQKPQTSVRDFVNSLNLFADKQLTDAQKTQVSQQASIFFGQFDTDNVSGLSADEQKVANANVSRFVTDMQKVFAKQAPQQTNPAQQIADQSVTEDALKEDIQGLQNLGYKVTKDPSTGAIFLEKDGKTGKIEIGEDGNVKFSGCANEALGELSNQQAAKKLNAVLDGYMAQGFEPVGNPEKKGDMLVGTLKNQQTGQEVKIDLKTGQEVKE